MLYIGAAVLAFALLVSLGFFWLIDTSSGARFALTTLSSLGGVRLSVQKVEGRLRDRLTLTGVRLSRPKLAAQLDRLELVWEPERLLGGKLLVHDLAIAGVRIQDDTPLSAKAPDLTWPQVSGMVRRMDAEVRRFSLKGLTYRHLQQAPAGVTELKARLALKDGVLSLYDIGLNAPQGRASGELVAGLWRPSLRVDVVYVPLKPAREFDLFSLQARLLPGKAPEQMAGAIAVAGRSGGAQRLEVTGELGVTRTGFNVRSLRMVRPGEKGTLTGGGSMTLTMGEPIFSLALQGADLDLSGELKQPTRLSGTLTFSGTPSDYLGRFSLANKGEGWQTAALAADYRGGKDAIRLAPLSGSLLQGRVRGALDVAWSKGLRVAGTLSGRGMNPAMVAPDWSGVVNLDLSGSLQAPEKGELSGALNGKLLQSRLQGRDLQGELRGSFVGEKLRVERLFVAGKGFTLRGAGELDRRLDLAASVSDLSGLLPKASGALQAGGWVRWRDGRLAGAAAAKGSNIATSGARVASITLDAEVGPEQGYPMRLKAALGGVRVGRVRVETALLALQGTADRHTIRAELSSPGSSVGATLTGGYADGAWRGELARLSGTDNVGPFALAAPARLLVSGERFSVSPLVINGVGGERVELSGNVGGGAGSFSGNWREVNLARANRWLEGVELAGASSGNVSMQSRPGGRITLAGRADAHGSMVTDGRRVNLERLVATLEGGSAGLRTTVDLSLEKGAGTAHFDFRSRGPAKAALPDRGELSLQWSNLDLALLRPFVPPEFILDGRMAGLVTGRLLPGKRLDLKGHTAVSEGHLNWLSQGEEFDLSLDKADLDFTWRDRSGGAAKGRGDLTLAGQAVATGTYTSRGERLLVANGTLRIDADRQGSRARFDLALQEGGTLQAAFSSDSPAGAAIPATGDLSLQWSGVNTALLGPWLPGALNLQGELSGKANGRLLPGQRLEMAGEAGFAQGKAKWRDEKGEMTANVRQASLTFDWRGQTLTGKLSLALAESGQAQGDFLLPIPARLPVTPDRGGPLRGTLTGRVQEQGFLSAFFPGLVQESHGDLDLDLKAAGTWGNPSLTGTLQLSRAGGYLPSAGIKVSELQLSAQLERDRIVIERYRAISGGGWIAGEALVMLDGWQVAEYSGSLSGERFLTVDLPELRMFTSPQLSFKGSAEGVTLRGELRVPEMLVLGPPVHQGVTASPDVVMEGRTEMAQERRAPYPIDGRVRVILGDKVRVQASGIDATFGGNMYLVMKDIDDISSSGEISVVKGRYRAYGMDLDIERGRLYYVNDPVDRPTLDILALRKVGEVRAGVTVGGYLNAPVVKLYSEPPLPDVDILSYMVLGHPMGASGEQAGLLAAAAGLFSFGNSESLQEQIKDRLGLSTLGLEKVDTTSTGLMGYKEIPVAPSGEPAKQAQTGESVFTVGKYLTPKIYVSYGRSLVTGENLFRLRYDVFRHWQIETQSGSESGADLYYKLEFN